MPANLRTNIILYDGVCNFCNASINLIIRNDKKQRYHFAPLQSNTAKEILSENQVELNKETLETIILIEENKVFTHSTAALKIAKNLRFPFPILYGLIIVPNFIRNAVYNLIAKYRYKLFGKKDVCDVPDAKVRVRFLA